MLNQTIDMDALFEGVYRKLLSPGFWKEFRR
jgi:hypothetical protein